MSQVTVISGAERRRPWSDEQKRAIVEAAFAAGAKVAHVAAKADLRPSQIYRWRRDLGRPTELVPVVVTGDSGQAVGAAVLLVEFKDATVRVMADAPASLVSAALRSLKCQSARKWSPGSARNGGPSVDVSGGLSR